ncbi:MAG: heavy-metal-associated domain-containing protein [Flavobacteriaceae bacterium]|nr:heavy-metal-associated domain-containing protein [Flavobacteriaceae bacterium]
MRMKSLSSMALWMVILIGTSACKNASNPPIVTLDVENSSEPVQANALALLTIDGMVCEIGCAKFIEDQLNDLNGVSTAQVNFETKVASISFDSKLLELADFIKTVEDLESRFKVVNWNLEKQKSENLIPLE